MQSQNKQLEQQLAEKRSQQQQLKSSQQSQIEEKELEIVRLQNIAKSQQEKIEELNQKLKDIERSHSGQLEEIKVTSRKGKKELEQSYQSQISQLEQQLEQEKLRFNQQQADLQSAEEKIAAAKEIIEQIEQLKSDRETTAKNEVVLKSAKGVDYRKLRDLIAAEEWKKADQETSNVMLKVANRQSERWLYESHIDNFPCEDLRTINQLWLNYSDGKFGFSVQKEIYESLGGTREYDEKIWESFGDRVCWRDRGIWLQFDGLTDLSSAPRGQLPALNRLYIMRGNEISFLAFYGRNFLFYRLETCNL